ncbi:integrase catalytic domain-containing protein [Trichonephila clavipes]|nr:integrase catalytic domain-containing protein [Trichonephila clavipes]
MDIIERVPEIELNNKCHYLPHRPVIKLNSQTTKVRPVFDASASKRGKLSLKESLYKGINLLEIIPDNLDRFRMFLIGISADIEKSFLMLSVAPKDRDFLRYFPRLLKSKWWQGPAWLKENPENWPTGEIVDQPSEKDVERKKIKIVNIDLANDAALLWHLHNIPNYSKMVKVFGWILRFINNCRRPCDKCTEPELSFYEIESSERGLIRLNQKCYLSDIKLLNIGTFIARRGRHRTIYSDNGTNFRCASNELSKLDWDKITRETMTNESYPTLCSLEGGWWEKLVRIVKELLQRTLEDPGELIPFTPAMFLGESHSYSVSCIEEVDSQKLSKIIKYRRKHFDDLRQRFRREYLSEQIQKYNEKSSREPKVGEIVLIGDDNKKRLFWPMVKIIELIPGRDGKIRTVELKIQHGTVLGPVQRVYPLEIRVNENCVTEEVAGRSKPFAQPEFIGECLIKVEELPY